MPTSDHHNINTVLTVLRALGPRRVLDVGCGFGKYGVAIREYLDIWFERLDPASWKLNLVGIEACERYRSPIHDFVYNKVHYGEAQTVLPQLGEFDAVLIADVIEHLEINQAQELVRECFVHSPVVIISTPVHSVAQSDLCENPYACHRNLWTRHDFPPSVSVKTIRMVGCNIFIAARQPLPGSVLALTDPIDHVYLRSRLKLGNFGLPISVGLRTLCRWFA
jgi:hypothetical protein